MAISLLTNTPSLGAQASLQRTQGRLEQSIARLSSGLRINRAGDDAAGLAVSASLTAQIRGLAQASRNANDGVSMIQTAEGALGEMANILNRMRELAVQASNEGTLGASERAFLDTEFDALRNELDRITDVTEFNGQKLLDGSLSAGTNFQVGILNSSNDRVSVTVADSDATALSINSSDISSASNAQAAITALDTAIDRVSSRRSDLGAVQNRLEITISNLASMNENLSAANSRILDADVAHETAELTKAQILVQAGASVLAQANQAPALALSLIG